MGERGVLYGGHWGLFATTLLVLAWPRNSLVSMAQAGSHCKKPLKGILGVRILNMDQPFGVTRGRTPLKSSEGSLRGEKRRLFRDLSRGKTALHALKFRCLLGCLGTLISQSWLQVMGLMLYFLGQAAYVSTMLVWT